MHKIPRIVTDGDGRQPGTYDPAASYRLGYAAREHRELPHVVKVSGGRSSAMLLFSLLENGVLDAARGDVVIFNNTACEHPETYRFIAECKRLTETTHRIPFFLNEFQTYEDARHGSWRRLPSYRLVNDRPAGDGNPDGFHWRGEAFEEFLSHKAYLPNRHRRICTSDLKLKPTRDFLGDWLAAKDGTDALGHQGARSRIELDEMYRVHRRAGGTVPKRILFEKRRYMLSQPPNRPGQTFGTFSAAARRFDNPKICSHVFGGRARIEVEAAEYVALIGLRADEPARVGRIHRRATNPHARAGSDGEHVLTPLADMHVRRADVLRFWRNQEFDLGLDPADELSNCVYCFMKGAKALRTVHRAMENPPEVPGFGPTANTPCDIEWWRRIERTYGRDLIAENRMRADPNGPTRIGFFGRTAVDYCTITSTETGPRTLKLFEEEAPASSCMP